MISFVGYMHTNVTSKSVFTIYTMYTHVITSINFYMTIVSFIMIQLPKINLNKQINICYLFVNSTFLTFCHITRIHFDFITSTIHVSNLMPT